MRTAFVSIVALLAGPALASPCKPKSVPSASPTSSLALPSATSGSTTTTTTTNPGQACDASANLFVDGDIASADLPAWPHNVTQGSGPTFTRSTNCSIYPACIDIGLAVGGGAQAVAFSQTLTAVAAGAAYTGHFFYRMTEFIASGGTAAMATLTCTANGATKFTKTLCAGEQSADWKQVSFGVAAAGAAEVVFACAVSTAAVGAEFQFSDFVMNESC